MPRLGLLKAVCVCLSLGVAALPAVAQDDASPSPINLETPQAALEHFFDAAHDEDFASAARALDFRLLPDADRARVAERLWFVLNQTLTIDWDTVPDRPDGMVDVALPSVGQQPAAGMERRSIPLGHITLDGREITVRLRRQSANEDRGATGEGGERTGGEGEAEGVLSERPPYPEWLFSANTVANVPALYEAYGPGWLERQMPSWAKERVYSGLAWWQLIGLALALIVAPLAGYAVAQGLKRLVSRLSVLRAISLNQFLWSVSAVVATVIFWVAVAFLLSLPSFVAAWLKPVALLLVAFAVTWMVMKIVNTIVERVGKTAIERFHDEGSEEEKQVLTQLTVARHAVLLVTALAGLGVVLLQLDLARTLGATLLGSAGVAAVVLSIAGHAVLGNLIAGVQIALTQPFRLGDSVFIEGNWGTVSRITYTYVVVTTWDERRLVLPIRYFVSNPFENWSLDDTHLVKPIYLHVDYTAPVDAIREKFEAVVREDELYDEDSRDPETLVTEIEDEVLVVRLTCGAPTPSDAWYMHCRAREKMVAWLQEFEDGRYLPRRRVRLTGRGWDDDDSAEATPRSGHAASVRR